MSRFGRSGPPPIRDTYSLLVLNITFRTTADDLSPLFEKYGEVVDIYIPRDRRTGDSRGFAFVRYKYEDEAQKAVDRLDGRVVDGREIMVQFAKYGPNAERIHKGKIMETVPRSRGRSRSRSPRRGYRDDYRERDYRKRSRSRDRYGRDRYRERDYRRRSRSRSYTPDDYRRRSRDSVSPARRSPSRSRSRSYSPDDYRKRGKHSQSPSRKSPSMSPARRSPSVSPARRSASASPARKSPSRSPRRTPSSQEGSPVKCYDESRRSRSPSTINGAELFMSRGCLMPDDEGSEVLADSVWSTSKLLLRLILFCAVCLDDDGDGDGDDDEMMRLDHWGFAAKGTCVALA
uniref:RRM domain-containing protein n=1 Tax=Oryza punctata TaxID=4537 RepID=A0A0E0LNJ1_ORYPU